MKLLITSPFPWYSVVQDIGPLVGALIYVPPGKRAYRRQRMAQHGGCL